MPEARERNPDWLYHDDIGGVDAPPVTLTIRGVSTVECGSRDRVGLEFRYRRRGAQNVKTLVLNETNVKAVQDLLGSDTDAWVGRRIVLHVIPDSGGGYGPGIRVRRTE